MRVKKDKSYVVVSVERGYIQGAFPYTDEGKKDAQIYKRKLTKKTKEKYEIRIV